MELDSGFSKSTALVLASSRFVVKQDGKSHLLVADSHILPNRNIRQLKEKHWLSLTL
jgi:hypothetical protein